MLNLQELSVLSAALRMDKPKRTTVAEVAAHESMDPRFDFKVAGTVFDHLRSDGYIEVTGEGFAEVTPKGLAQVRVSRDFILNMVARVPWV